MTGLVKAKKYDWKDSNVAMFGSDTDRQVKKESAETEPAWSGAGQEVGLKIWRIVKFEVTEWPAEDYGSFYSGDSYIILNTYQEEGSDELLYDVHFWIGKHSTQDEYGTAAYKTVELDTLLDDKAVQHREVEGHESSIFSSYFEKITVMRGGADTGFRHVVPEEYVPRLLMFNGKGANIKCTEVPLNRARLNPDDVFILDQGLQIFQWNGEGANGMEKIKAAQFVTELKGERGKAESEVLDQADISESHPFYEALNEDDEEDDDDTDGADTKELVRISDESGEMTMTPVKSGEISLADFCANDVFILDCGKAAYVWIGKDASPNEKKNGFAYAQSYLSKTNHAIIPVTVLREGQKNAEFEAALAA